MIPPRLATTDDKPCPYSFKYINYKDDYQVNINKCPYWQNCFNKEWHGIK